MTPRKTVRNAVKILIQSPMYFRLNLKARKALITEFCTLHL